MNKDRFKTKIRLLGVVVILICLFQSNQAIREGVNNENEGSARNDPLLTVDLKEERKKATVVSETELLTNGDYESGIIDPWISSNPAEVSLMIDSSVKRTGSYSLRLAMMNNVKTSDIYQSAFIDGGTDFTFSAHVIDNTSEALCQLKTFFYDSDDQLISYIESADDSHDSDSWQQLSLSGTTPEMTTKIKVVIFVSSSGSQSMWIDDVSLMGTGSSTATEEIEMLWNNNYGGTGTENAYSVIQTPDGGLAAIGDTNSYGAGNTDAWLIKTDASGSMQWSRTYGGSNFDKGRRLIITPDGGFALGGHTKSSGAGETDFWFIKTDSSGIEQWSRTYGSNLYENLNDMIQTSDMGYLLIGDSKPSSMNYDCLLVKIDSNGNMQWNQTISEPGTDRIFKVIETTDGSFVIAGITTSHDADREDFWLTKLFSNGIEQWTRIYGIKDLDICNDFTETQDGGYALVGSSVTLGPTGSTEDYDMSLIKTDSNGIKQWSRTYGGYLDDYGSGIIQLADSGFLLAGRTESFTDTQNGIDTDAWIIKTDVEGNIEQNQTFDVGRTDMIYSMTRLPYNGYILAGYTWVSSTYRSNAFLIRINYAGGQIIDSDEIYTLTGHSTGISSVSFNPDSTMLASAANRWGPGDDSIKIWNLTTGTEIPILALSGLMAPTRVSFSPDGEYLAFGDHSQYVTVYNVSSWSSIRGLSHANDITDIVFSPDGDLLAASCSYDMYETIKIWDVETGNLVQTFNFSAITSSIAFSPDGKILASAHADIDYPVIMLWNVTSGNVINWIWHDSEVLDVAFSNDGQYLASASGSNITIRDTNGYGIVQSVDLFNGWVFSLAFSPDSKMLATGSDLNVTRLWNVIDLTLIDELRSLNNEVDPPVPPGAGAVTSVSFNSDGSLLATGSDDGTIKVWNISINTGNNEEPDLPSISTNLNEEFVYDSILSVIVTCNGPGTGDVFLDGSLITTLVLMNSATFSLDTTSYPDGLHNLTIAVTDTNGKVVTRSYMIEFNNNPAIPLSVIANLTGGSIYSGLITVVITSNQPSSGDIFLDGSLFTSLVLTNTTIFMINTAASTDGLHNITIILHDSAGNELSTSYTVEFFNPRSYFLLTANVTAGSTYSGRLTIMVTSSKTATGSVYLDGSLLASLVLMNTDSLSIDTSSYPDGQHNLTLTAVDIAGNGLVNTYFINFQNSLTTTSSAGTDTSSFQFSTHGFEILPLLVTLVTVFILLKRKKRSLD